MACTAKPAHTPQLRTTLRVPRRVKMRVCCTKLARSRGAAGSADELRADGIDSAFSRSDALGEAGAVRFSGVARGEEGGLLACWYCCSCQACTSRPTRAFDASSASSVRLSMDEICGSRGQTCTPFQRVETTHVDDVVERVRVRRQVVAERGEVRQHALSRPCENGRAPREQKNLVKLRSGRSVSGGFFQDEAERREEAHEGESLRPGQVTAEDDYPAIGSQALQSLEDLEGGRTVEPARGLVEEQDRRERDERATDAEPPSLAAADPPSQRSAHEDIRHVTQAELGHGLLDDGGTLCWRDRLGEAQRGCRLERLAHGEVGQEGVVLPDVADGLFSDRQAGRRRPRRATRLGEGDLACRQLEVPDAPCEHVQEGGCAITSVSRWVQAGPGVEKDGKTRRRGWRRGDRGTYSCPNRYRRFCR